MKLTIKTTNSGKLIPKTCESSHVTPFNVLSNSRLDRFHIHAI